MTEMDMVRERRIKWWREARFGMFIHWGLYSIPAGVWKDKVYPTGYSEWIMFSEKIPVREYELLAGKFNPAKFDARGWVDTAKKAGMKYIVLTTKHHDGFSMFKSKLSPYNIVDATPFKRDVTKELADACREAGIRFGCYYSTDRHSNKVFLYFNSYHDSCSDYYADFGMENTIPLDPDPLVPRTIRSGNYSADVYRKG